MYAIIGNDKQVAKIFKENKRDTWREKKLRLVMQEKLSEEQMQQITWSQDIIYDGNELAGNIMPKLVNASSFMELYMKKNMIYGFA